MPGERRPRFWRPLWNRILGSERPYPFFRWLNPFVSVVVDEPGGCEGNGYPFSFSASSLARKPSIWFRLWYWEIHFIFECLSGLWPKDRWYWRWWRRTPVGWSTMGRWESEKE